MTRYTKITTITLLVAVLGATTVTQAVTWTGTGNTWYTITRWTPTTTPAVAAVPNVPGETAVIGTGVTVTYPAPPAMPNMTLTQLAPLGTNVVMASTVGWQLAVGNAIKGTGIPNNTTIAAFDDTSITLSAALTATNTTTVTPYFGGPVTIDSLTVTNGSTLLIDLASSQPLNVTGGLTNSATISLRNGGETLDRELIYTGTAFNNSGGTINVFVNNGSSARSALFTLNSDNANDGTIHISSDPADIGTAGVFNKASRARLLLTGTGTFLNNGTIKVIWGRNNAFFSGPDAAYDQTGAAAVTELGSVWVPGYDPTEVYTNLTDSMKGCLEAGTVQFSDGTLKGNNGLVIELAGDQIAQIGNDDGIKMTVAPGGASVGTLSFGNQTTIYERPDSIVWVQRAATMTSLQFNSDAIFQADINTSSLTSDVVRVYGDLKITSGAVLTVTDIGADVALPRDTTLTLVSYTGTWDAGTFHLGSDAGPVLADDSTFTLGKNTFVIDYDGGVGSNEVLLRALGVPEGTTVVK